MREINIVNSQNHGKDEILKFVYKNWHGHPFFEIMSKSNGIKRLCEKRLRQTKLFTKSTG